MAVEATRPEVAHAPPVEPPPAARGNALRVFAWSRIVVWAGALFALWSFSGARNPRAPTWGLSVMHDLGAITDVWARWDSAYFLKIAEHGYASAGGAAAFYPLYPGLTGILGRILLGHYVLAGLVIALAGCLASLVLLERLGRELLGEGDASRAVLYLALFPMSVFLQAVYSESVFIALTLAAFLLAERGRHVHAGAAAGLALLTRPLGFALVPALLLLAWRRGALRQGLAGTGVAAALFALFPLVLWQQLGRPFAFANEDLWHRHLSPAGPLGGIWHGTSAAWAGVRQLFAGSHGHVYWTNPHITDLDPMYVAAQNLEQFGFLVLFVALAVLAWRRLGAPYGLFAVVGLAIPLSVPSAPWPLLSLSRFGLALFPLFLALATLGRRRRSHDAIVGVSAVLLGIAVVQWALWQWVA